jgi:ubiquitin C-terminal hydrolase
MYVKGPQSVSAPPIYDLYAVSLHSGGLGGGHYTAVCKNPVNNKWYESTHKYFISLFVLIVLLWSMQV